MAFPTKKSLGQNFLVNPHILDKIVVAADVSKDDIILEVGPGTGLLTKKLADKAGRVVAIEKDHRLIEILNETFKNYPNVEIFEDDALELNIQDTRYKIPDTDYKIVANIPYYITSNFLRKISEDWPQPKLIVLTIQKEVAQRIIVKTPHMNLLALSIQYYFEPKIIGFISRNNFRPVPNVDSAIIKLIPNGPKTDNKENIKKLFELMRTGFSEKRKQLATLLSKKLKLDKERILDAFGKEGIKENARAENLSIEQWEELNKLLNI